MISYCWPIITISDYWWVKMYDHQWNPTSLYNCLDQQVLLQGFGAKQGLAKWRNGWTHTNLWCNTNNSHLNENFHHICKWLHTSNVFQRIDTQSSCTRGGRSHYHNCQDPRLALCLRPFCAVITNNEWHYGATHRQYMSQLRIRVRELDGPKCYDVMWAIPVTMCWSGHNHW